MKMYVRCEIIVQVDVDPEDYEVTTREELAEALNDNPDAHEHLSNEMDAVEWYGEEWLDEEYGDSGYGFRLTLGDRVKL